MISKQIILWQKVRRSYYEKLKKKMEEYEFSLPYSIYIQYERKQESDTNCVLASLEYEENLNKTHWDFNNFLVVYILHTPHTHTTHTQSHNTNMLSYMNIYILTISSFVGERKRNRKRENTKKKREITFYFVYIKLIINKSFFLFSFSLN